MYEIKNIVSKIQTKKTHDFHILYGHFEEIQRSGNVLNSVYIYRNSIFGKKNNIFKHSIIQTTNKSNILQFVHIVRQKCIFFQS